jgi:NAD(P)-dependent dehydrogenase (short-subunit alcohol dehydrogenase family)
MSVASSRCRWGERPVTEGRLDADAAAHPLKGQHAVVTGASRGIGAAIAAKLVRLGADVTLMSRSEAALADQVAQLAQTDGGRAQAAAVDVADEARIISAFTAAGEAFGPVAILVNNAGIAEAAPFAKTDRAFWQHLIDVDLTGPYLCIRQVVGPMVKAGRGRIINVASTAGHTGYPYVTAYCAAKHGLIGLTRALAREIARSGVTVNAVCPGYTATDVVESAITNIMNKTKRTREQAIAELVAHNPQGRLVTPEEVAEAVGWLCLPTAAAINGQSIMVDGGELM